MLTVAGLLLLSPLDHPLGTPAIARSLGDVRADWRAMLRDAQASFSSLFLGELVVGAAVLADGLLVVITSISTGRRLVCYKQAILLNRTAAVSALRESLRMTAVGRATFGLSLVLVTIYGCAIGLEWSLAGGVPSFVLHAASVVGMALLLAWMNALVTFARSGSTRPDRPRSTASLCATDRR